MYCTDSIFSFTIQLFTPFIFFSSFLLSFFLSFFLSFLLSFFLSVFHSFLLSFFLSIFLPFFSSFFLSFFLSFPLCISFINFLTSSFLFYLYPFYSIFHFLFYIFHFIFHIFHISHLTFVLFLFFFCSTLAVSNFNDESFIRDYDSWRIEYLKRNIDGPRNNEFYFSSYPFLFSAEAKKRLIAVKARLHQILAQHIALTTATMTGERY